MERRQQQEKENQWPIHYWITMFHAQSIQRGIKTTIPLIYRNCFVIFQQLLPLLIDFSIDQILQFNNSVIKYIIARTPRANS